MFKRGTLKSIKKPRLLFKTDFSDGLNLDAPTMIGNDTTFVYSQAWCYFSGTDSRYGYVSTTAFNDYFGKNVFILQLLPNVSVTGTSKPDATANMTALLEGSLQATTIPNENPNAKELFINVKNRNAAANGQQIPFILQRFRNDYPSPNSIPIKDIPSCGWSYRFVIDSNAANLLPTNYLIVSEVKTGDLPSPYPGGFITASIGSFRYKTLITKDSATGLLYYSTSLDNNAGSKGVVPINTNAKTGFLYGLFALGTANQTKLGDIVRGATSGAVGKVSFIEMRVRNWGNTGKGVLILTPVSGQPFNFSSTEVVQSQPDGVTWGNSFTLTNLWSGQEDIVLNVNEYYYKLNETYPGSVELNTPLQLDLRFIRPKGGRTDINTGVFQAVITNLINRKKLVLCNFVGGIQHGSMEDPVTRLMFLNDYTSYNYPNLPVDMKYKLTRFELYDDLPYDIIPNTLFDLTDLGNGVTVGALTRTTVGNNRNFEQDITGTGNSNGLVMPTDFLHVIGKGTTLYNQFLTDSDMFLAADGGTPKVTDSLVSSTGTIAGGTIDENNLLSEFSRLGYSPTYLENKILTRNVSLSSTPAGTPQLATQINRSRTFTGSIEDLDEFYWVGYMKFDPNLDTILKYPAGSPPENWISPGIEFKTGQYNGNYGYGDLRLALNIEKYATGMAWVLKLDNNAGGSGVVPLVPSSPVETFWSLNTKFAGGDPSVLIPDYPVQPGKWFKYKIYHRRTKLFTDLTTGRTIFSVTPMDTGIETVIFDKIGDVHTGRQQLPITRIFINNAYYGSSVVPYANKVAGIKIYRKKPENELKYQDKFLNSDYGSGMCSSEKSMMNAPSAPWATSSIIEMGNRLHGDAVPSAWASAVPAPSGANAGLLTTAWQDVAGFVTVVPSVNNTCTNAGVLIYNFEMYYYNTTTQQWILLSTISERRASVMSYYGLNTNTLVSSADALNPNTIPYPAFCNVDVSGDRVSSSNIVSKYKTLRGELSRKSVDYTKFGGLIVSCNAKLIPINGLTFNGNVELMLQVGAFAYPRSSDNLNSGILTGIFNVPTVGVSGFKVIPSNALTGGNNKFIFSSVKHAADGQYQEGSSNYAIANGVNSMAMSYSNFRNSNSPSLLK